MIFVFDLYFVILSFFLIKISGFIISQLTIHHRDNPQFKNYENFVIVLNYVTIIYLCYSFTYETICNIFILINNIFKLFCSSLNYLY